MTTITFIESDGTEHIVVSKPGLSLMETAKQNNVPGIDADCGGCCVCGTCHVFVAPEWQARVGSQNPLETATMEFVEEIQPNSRLSCQIEVTDQLEGLVVFLPESQR